MQPGADSADSGAGDDEARRGRPFCYRCHKPELTCICSTVKRVSNVTPVWILQHPRERFHPIGTARIARLGLERVHVDVRHRDKVGPPPEFPAHAALLYPKKGAAPLESVAERPPGALVVLDGTWAHARTLYRDNPWLHSLPRYGLAPPRPSNYRIRKEPAPQCVSTIESVVYALTQLEPDTEGLHGLLNAFEGMIDEQIRLYRERRTGARRSNKPRRQFLGAPPAHRVLVEAEAVARDPSRPRPGAERDLVYWCAVRVHTGEVFERVVRPTQMPSALHCHHMELPLDALAEGLSTAALERDWRAFLKPEDVVIGWTKSTIDVRPADGGLPTRVLKSAFCNARRGSRGTLEQMFEREQLPLPELGLQGRAGKRLAAALAMYRVLAAKLDTGGATS